MAQGIELGCPSVGGSVSLIPCQVVFPVVFECVQRLDRPDWTDGS